MAYGSASKKIGRRDLMDKVVKRLMAYASYLKRMKG